MTDISSVREVWRSVVGYEGSYEVSDLGRVRSLPRLNPHRTGYVHRLRGCTLKPTPQAGGGHLQVSLGKPLAGRKYFTVHTLVLTAFVGPRPEGMEGCHSDGDPANNRLDNLRWDTSTANHFDSVRHGTHHNAAKTACRRGHPYVQASLVRAKLPSRECRACRTAWLQNDYRVKTNRSPIDVAAYADQVYAKLTAG